LVINNKIDSEARSSDAGQQTKELKPGKERSFRRRRKPKEEKRGE